ncbi:hypothetical protein [Bacillus paramycoides]|uniref:hypothetical protein n=1 Tax=Bacillus paramycoides TaxID=2026194 RepID=UPI003D014731
MIYISIYMTKNIQVEEDLLQLMSIVANLKTLFENYEGARLDHDGTMFKVTNQL